MGGGEAYKGPNFTYVFILKVDISLIMDLFCTSFDLKKKMHQNVIYQLTSFLVPP